MSSKTYEMIYNAKIGLEWSKEDISKLGAELNDLSAKFLTKDLDEKQKEQMQKTIDTARSLFTTKDESGAEMLDSSGHPMYRFIDSISALGQDALPSVIRELQLYGRALTDVTKTTKKYEANERADAKYATAYRQMMSSGQILKNASEARFTNPEAQQLMGISSRFVERRYQQLAREQDSSFYRENLANTMVNDQRLREQIRQSAARRNITLKSEDDISELIRNSVNVTLGTRSKIRESQHAFAPLYQSAEKTYHPEDIFRHKGIADLYARAGKMDENYTPVASDRNALAYSDHLFRSLRRLQQNGNESAQRIALETGLAKIVEGDDGRLRLNWSSKPTQDQMRLFLAKATERQNQIRSGQAIFSRDPLSNTNVNKEFAELLDITNAYARRANDEKNGAKFAENFINGAGVELAANTPAFTKGRHTTELINSVGKIPTYGVPRTVIEEKDGNLILVPRTHEEMQRVREKSGKLKASVVKTTEADKGIMLQNSQLTYMLGLDPKKNNGQYAEYTETVEGPDGKQTERTMPHIVTVPVDNVWARDEEGWLMQGKDRRLTREGQLFRDSLNKKITYGEGGAEYSFVYSNGESAQYIPTTKKEEITNRLREKGLGDYFRGFDPQAREGVVYKKNKNGEWVENLGETNKFGSNAKRLGTQSNRLADILPGVDLDQIEYATISLEAQQEVNKILGKEVFDKKLIDGAGLIDPQFSHISFQARGLGQTLKGVFGSYDWRDFLRRTVKKGESDSPFAVFEDDQSKIEEREKEKKEALGKWVKLANTNASQEEIDAAKEAYFKAEKKDIQSLSKFYMPSVAFAKLSDDQKAGIVNAINSNGQYNEMGRNELLGHYFTDAMDKRYGALIEKEMLKGPSQMAVMDESQYKTFLEQQMDIKDAAERQSRLEKKEKAGMTFVDAHGQKMIQLDAPEQNRNITSSLRESGGLFAVKSEDDFETSKRTIGMQLAEAIGLSDKIRKQSAESYAKELLRMETDDYWINEKQFKERADIQQRFEQAEDKQAFIKTDRQAVKYIEDQKKALYKQSQTKYRLSNDASFRLAFPFLGSFFEDAISGSNARINEESDLSIMYPSLLKNKDFLKKRFELADEDLKGLLDSKGNVDINKIMFAPQATGDRDGLWSVVGRTPSALNTFSKMLNIAATKTGAWRNILGTQSNVAMMDPSAIDRMNTGDFDGDTVWMYAHQMDQMTKGLEAANGRAFLTDEENAELNAILEEQMAELDKKPVAKNTGDREVERLYSYYSGQGEMGKSSQIMRNAIDIYRQDGDREKFARTYNLASKYYDKATSEGQNKGWVGDYRNAALIGAFAAGRQFSRFEKLVSENYDVPEAEREKNQPSIFNHRLHSLNNLGALATASFRGKIRKAAGGMDMGFGDMVDDWIQNNYGVESGHYNEALFDIASRYGDILKGQEDLSYLVSTQELSQFFEDSDKRLKAEIDNAKTNKSDPEIIKFLEREQSFLRRQRKKVDTPSTVGEGGMGDLLLTTDNLKIRRDTARTDYEKEMYQGMLDLNEYFKTNDFENIARDTEHQSLIEAEVNKRKYESEAIRKSTSGTVGGFFNFWRNKIGNTKPTTTQIEPYIKNAPSYDAYRVKYGENGALKPEFLQVTDDEKYPLFWNETYQKEALGNQMAKVLGKPQSYGIDAALGSFMHDVFSGVILDAEKALVDSGAGPDAKPVYNIGDFRKKAKELWDSGKTHQYGTDLTWKEYLTSNKVGNLKGAFTEEEWNDISTWLGEADPDKELKASDPKRQWLFDRIQSTFSPKNNTNDYFLQALFGRGRLFESENQIYDKTKGVISAYGANGTRVQDPTGNPGDMSSFRPDLIWEEENGDLVMYDWKPGEHGAKQSIFQMTNYSKMAKDESQKAYEKYQENIKNSKETDEAKKREDALSGLTQEERRWLKFRTDSGDFRLKKVVGVGYADDGGTIEHNLNDDSERRILGSIKEARERFIKARNDGDLSKENPLFEGLNWMLEHGIVSEDEQVADALRYYADNIGTYGELRKNIDDFKKANTGDNESFSGKKWIEGHQQEWNYLVAKQAGDRTKLSELTEKIRSVGGKYRKTARTDADNFSMFDALYEDMSLLDDKDLITTMMAVYEDALPYAVRDLGQYVGDRNRQKEALDAIVRQASVLDPQMAEASMRRALTGSSKNSTFDQVQRVVAQANQAAGTRQSLKNPYKDSFFKISNAEDLWQEAGRLQLRLEETYGQNTPEERAAREAREKFMGSLETADATSVYFKGDNAIDIDSFMADAGLYASAQPRIDKLRATEADLISRIYEDDRNNISQEVDKLIGRDLSPEEIARRSEADKRSKINNKILAYKMDIGEADENIETYRKRLSNNFLKKNNIDYAAASVADIDALMSSATESNDRNILQQIRNLQLLKEARNTGISDLETFLAGDVMGRDSLSYLPSMARAMSYNSLMDEIDRRRSESGEETLQQTLDRIHAAPTPAVPTPAVQTPAEPVPAPQAQPEPAPAPTAMQTRQPVVIQTSAANRTPYEPTVFAGQPAPEQVKIPERVLTQEQVDSARTAMEQARTKAETAEKESQRAQNEYSTYQKTATEAQKNRADEIQKQQEATDNADAEVKRLTEERNRIQKESDALRSRSGTSALERTITPEQVQAARANMELAQANAISAQETATQASQAYTGYQETVAQNQATRAAAISEQEQKAANSTNANAEVQRLIAERDAIQAEEKALNERIQTNEAHPARERLTNLQKQEADLQSEIAELAGKNGFTGEIPKYLGLTEGDMRARIRSDLLQSHPELYQQIGVPEEIERMKPTEEEMDLVNNGDRQLSEMRESLTDDELLKSVLSRRLGDAHSEHEKRVSQIKAKATERIKGIKAPALGIFGPSKGKQFDKIQEDMRSELHAEEFRYNKEQAEIRDYVRDNKESILTEEREAKAKDLEALQTRRDAAVEKDAAYREKIAPIEEENKRRAKALDDATWATYWPERDKIKKYEGAAIRNRDVTEKESQLAAIRKDIESPQQEVDRLDREKEDLTKQAGQLAERKAGNAEALEQAQSAADAAEKAAAEAERLKQDDAEKNKAESAMLASLKTSSEQAAADATQKDKDAKSATRTYTETFKAFKNQEKSIIRANNSAKEQTDREKELAQKQASNADALTAAQTVAQNAATATQTLITEDADKTKAENDQLTALKQVADQSAATATQKTDDAKKAAESFTKTEQAFNQQESAIAEAEKAAKAQRAAEEEKVHRVARDAALRPISMAALQGSHATKAGQRDDIRAAIRLGSGLDQYVFGPDGTIQRIKTPKPDEAPTPQVIQVGSAPSQQPPTSAAPMQQPQAGANAPTGTDASNNEAAGQTTEKPAPTPFKFDRNWQETDKISESRVGQIQENAKAAAYNRVQEERKYYEELAKTDAKTRNETWSASELDAFEKLKKRVDTKEAREATIGAYANYFAERQINAENLNATLGENRITAIDENSALAVKNMQLQYDQYHRNKRAQWIGRDAITRSMLEWQSRNESLASQQESLKTSMGQAGRNVEAKRTAWKNASAEEKAQREQEYKEAVANQSGLQAKYNAVTEEINKSSGPLGAATAAFNGLGTAISNVASRLGRRLFMNATREITQFVKQFDTALTQIQMITMKSDDQMSQLGTTLISKAKELKISVAEISSTATALYRQGLSDEEVDERLETISKFSKVSGTKVDAATKLVTVAMNTGLVNSAGEAADIVTILGDSAATNAAEIEKGVEKSGAAAAADGTSFGQLAAMLTAITSTTQVGGNIAGRTLSTIMQRMNKVGTGELVYDENGNAVSGSSIAKLIEANGVDVYRDGKKRSTFDILYDLSQNWDSMSDAAKQQLSTNIAGRQYSNFSAIMQGMSEGDIDRYMELLEGSEGTVDKKFDIYEKSLAAGITNVKNAFDDLINTLTENGAIERFFDGITTIIDGLNNLAKGFGGAATAAIPLIEALAGITMMKMGIATANPVLALGGLGLAAVGVGTAYFNGKQDTRTATEKYDQKVESVSSVYNERLKNASRLRELASKDQLSNEEKSEYGYLVDTLAAFSGLGDEAVSAAKNVETLSASASKLGESAKQAAQDIADAADKEAENEKIRKFYNEGISGAAESIAEEGNNKVTEFYQNEGSYQSIVAGSKKLAKKKGMSFPEAYTAEDFKNYFIQAGDLFGDKNLHQNMIAFAANQSENNINLPDEYRRKDKSWWTTNLYNTPDEVIQMMLDDARSKFTNSDTNSAKKQKQGIIDRAKSVFTDLGLSGDYVDFAAQKLAEDYYNDPKIKEFLDKNGYYPQVDSFVVEQLLAEAIGKDINPKGEKSVAESALKEYARKGGYADKAAWLEQLSLEDAGVGGYYIDEEGRRITASQAEQRVNDYNNRLELERTEYQLAEADETGKAIKNGKVFGAYNWQTNGTTEDAEKAAKAAKEQGVYYYTRQDGTIVDRDENGNLFTSEEARDAAQAASDASQELWQSTFYDPNTGITYKSKIGTKEEAANDESFIQLRQDIASKAFGLKTTAGDELFGDEYKFGSYVEAQAAAGAFNKKERERYATQMAAAKAEQQANTSASYVNAQGETVSFYGADAHAQAEAARNAELEKGGYVVYDEQGQYYTTAATEDEARQIYADNFMHYYDTYGNDYGVGSEGRANFEKAKQEYEANVDNYDYYVNGRFVGRGQEGKDLTEGLSEVYDIGTGETFYSRKDAEKALATKKSKIENAAMKYQIAEGMSRDDAYKYATYDVIGSTDWAGQINTTSSNVEARLQGEFKLLDDSYSNIADSYIAPVEQIIEGIQDNIPELANVDPAQLVNVYGQLPTEIQTMLTEASQTGEYTLDLIKTVNDALTEVPMPKLKTVKDHFRAGVSVGASAWDSKNSMAVTADNMLRMIESNGISNVVDLFKYVNENDIKQWSALNSNEEFGHLMDQYGFEIDENGNVTQTGGSSDITPIKTLLMSMGRDYGKEALTTREQGQRAEAALGILQSDTGFVSRESAEYYAGLQRQEKIRQWEIDNGIRDANGEVISEDIDWHKEKDLQRKYQTFLKENHLTSDADYADFLKSTSLDDNQREYLKGVLGEQLAQRLFNSKDKGEALSAEENKLINTLVSNASYGVSGLTASDKIAGIRDIYGMIRSGQKITGYSDIAASQYMAGFGQWSEYRMLKEQEEAGTISPEDLELLKQYDVALDNFVKNSEIEIELKGLQELENAGELLEGTSALVEKLKKGGKFAIEAVVKLTTETYSQGQQSAMLQNGTLQQQHEAAMSILGMSAEQFYQDAYGNTERARQIDQQNRELMAKSREEEWRAAMESGDTAAAQDIVNSMTNAGFTSEVGEVEEEYTLEDAVRGKSGLEYGLAAARWLANGGKRKVQGVKFTDTGATNVDVINPALQEKENWTEKELATFGAGILGSTQFNASNAEEYTAAYNSLGFYGKDYLRQREQLKLTTQGELMSAEKELEDAKSVGGTTLEEAQAKVDELEKKITSLNNNEVPEELQRAYDLAVAEAELAARQADETDFAKNLTLENKLDETTAQEAAKNRTIFLYGTDSEQYAATAGYQKNVRDLRNANYYLDHVSAQSSGVLAEYLGVDEQTVKESLKTDEGKNELRKAINDKAKKLFASMAEALGADLGDLNLETADLSAVKEAVTKAAEYLGEEEKNLLLSVAGVITDAGDVLGQKAQTVADVFDDIIGESDAERSKKQAGSWLMDNYEQFTGQQVATVEKQYDLPEGYTLGSDGKIRNAEGKVDRLWTNEYQNRTPVYETRELSYQEAMQKYMDDNGIDFDVAGYFADNHAAGNLARMYDSGRLSGKVLSQYIASTLYGNELAPQFYDNLAGDLFGNLYSNGQFDVSQAQLIKDMYESYTTGENAANGGQEAMGLMDSKYGEFFKAIADAKTLDQAEEAIRALNEQMADDKAAAATKYAKGMSNVSQIISGLRKGGKDAAQATAALNKNMKTYQDQMTAVSKAKDGKGNWKKGSQVKGQTRQILADWLGVDAKDVEKYTAEEMEEFFGGMEDAINKSATSDLNAIWQDKLAQIQEQFPTFDLSQIEINADGSINTKGLDEKVAAAINQAVAEMESYAGPLAELIFKLVAGEEGGLPKLNLEALVNKNGSGKYNGGGGGGGGGGESDAQKMLKRHKHEVTEAEHKVKMEEIYQTHYDFINDYDAYIDSLGKEEQAYADLSAVYERQIGELEGMMGSLEAYSDDWWSVKEALDAAKESLADVQNKIDAIETKRVDIIIQKQENEDKPTTQKQSLWEQKARGYQIRGQFESYAVSEGERLKEIEEQRKQNEEQIAELEKTLAETTEGSDAWLKARDQLWAMQVENATYANDIEEGRRALATATVQQYQTDLENRLTPRNHVDNMLSTYGQLYQTNRQYDEYRAALTQQNEVGRENIGLYTQYRDQLIEYMATLEEGSEAWYAARDAIYQYDEALAQATASEDERKRAIEQSYVDELKQKYEELNKDLTHTDNILKAQQDRYDKNNNFTMYQQVLSERLEVTRNKLAELETQLQGYLDLQGEITEGTDAWDALKESAQSTAEQIENAKNEEEELIRLQSQSKFEHDQEVFERQDNLDQHNLRMIQYEQTMYQNRGEYRNVNTMLEHENRLRAEMAQRTQDYIEVLKEDLALAEEGSDEYYKIAEAIYKAEENVKQHTNAIEKNTETMKKNEEQILKTHQTLINTIDNELKTREKERRERLAAEVNIQTQILNIIRNRYKQEWAIVKSDLDVKKKALQEEKALIAERLKARTNAEDREEKHAQLTELKRQLSIVSSDPTRTKDAKDLQKQIDDMEKEIARSEAQDEVTATQERLDEQMKAYDEFAAYQEQKLNEMLKDANSTQLWEEMSAAMGTDDMSREERIENYLDWIKQNDDNYKYGTEAMRMQLEQNNTDSWNKMLGWIETYWDEVHEIIDGGVETMIDFMKQSSAYQFAEEEASRKLMEWGWKEQFEDYENARKDDAEWNHDHDEIVTQIDDEVMDINRGILDMYGLQRQMYSFLTGIEYDYVRPTDVDPDAANSGYKDYAGVGRTVYPVGTDTGSGGGGGSGGSGSGSGGSRGNGRNKTETHTYYTYTSAYHRLWHQWSDGSTTCDAPESHDWNGNTCKKCGYKRSSVSVGGGGGRNNRTVQAYAKGGLVDYTGYAWVDGTKKKPESFLDAEDTANLKRLTDSMSYVSAPSMYFPGKEFFGNNSTVGDINIVINQAQINNDSDLDKLATEIGRKFTKQLSKEGLNLAGYAW